MDAMKCAQVHARNGRADFHLRENYYKSLPTGVMLPPPATRTAEGAGGACVRAAAPTALRALGVPPRSATGLRAGGPDPKAGSSALPRGFAAGAHSAFFATI